MIYRNQSFTEPKFSLTTNGILTVETLKNTYLLRSSYNCIFKVAYNNVHLIWLKKLSQRSAASESITDTNTPKQRSPLKKLFLAH